MLFYTALFLVKGTHLIAKNCSNGPMLMELIGVTLFSSILKQLLERMVECLSEDSIIASAKSRMEQVSLEDCMC
jgi:hypothetical protein